MKLETATSMDLNEWGDFLAGATAPLALFWIIIGYFLQGEELRLNTEALKLQQNELQNQVAETAKLAANSERQAAAAEQMASATLEEKQRLIIKELADNLPVFLPKGGSQSGHVYSTGIRNAGATVSELSIKSENSQISITISPTNVFEADAVGKITAKGISVFPFNFRISFTDRLGRRHTKKYEMTSPHRFRELRNE